jgi:hypothetical protein
MITSINDTSPLTAANKIHGFMKLMKLPVASTRAGLLFAFVVSTGIASYAQKAESDSLQKKFNRYRIQTTSEKIYAHTDQELYLTGETLWFKLYLVDASLHKPADLSKVAYLEILDRTNQPVLQSKVALKDGFGNGALFLPASLVAGNYTFRAYTNWMKNLGADFYFQKRITSLIPLRNLSLKNPSRYYLRMFNSFRKVEILCSA